MPCYKPIILYRSFRPNKNGKYPLVSIKFGNPNKPEKIPCGRCMDCRLEKSRQWAMRCVHEAKCHRDNMFLTLTYRDEELIYRSGQRATLYPLHLQLFMKRLRKAYGPGIRFFACGEYGEHTFRPHYHACIFGFDFPDKKLHSIKNDNYLYHSDKLDGIWSHGFCLIGDVSFESAAYVARYIVDKRLGKDAEFYEQQDIIPEFVRMSNRPGIGYPFFDKFQSDMFPNDYVVLRGKKMRTPRYYGKKYEEVDPVKMAVIKDIRRKAAENNADSNSKSRLKAISEVKAAAIQLLTRDLS